MKTDVEQTMPLDAAAVWADETSKPVKPKQPGARLASTLGILMLALAVGATIQTYLSGMETLRAEAAHFADNAPYNRAQEATQLLKQADNLALKMAAAPIAGGAGLLLVIFAGSGSLRRRWIKYQAETNREMEQQAQKLHSQLVDAKLLEEESRKNQAELEMRFGNVSRAQAALQRELDQRKQVEKSLAQQTQQLERSKDVLEMHVQLRTQELQKLQRRNELILNSAGEGICGFDLQDRATFVNPAAAKITGWRIDELLGKSETDIFFPNTQKGAKPAPNLLQDENGNLLPEQIFHRQDGSSFPVEYVRTPIKENGKVVGTVVMFKDITERKLAEDKLGQKAAELARSNGELEQFAFVASHDLQEPLRKIQAFGDRLKIKCEAVKLEEGRDYLERMQNAAARMQTLINDLLTFSRVIRSSQPFVPVDLDIVTREVLGDLEHRIERSKADVQVSKLPTIDADPLQMRQLLQNLIGNALKFQPAGAAPVVKIDAKIVKRCEIREDTVFPNSPLNTSPDDKFCLLTVQDNGIGFEEQYLEKIFAVFQRLHGRSEYEGTGVGLAVCRRITDRHGGIITAQSKPGEGATFVVILPVEQAKTEGQQ
jgi:two-component system sensor kinase FixL